MSLYRRPEKNFYILPNKIFTIDLDPYAFKIYSYLMSCAGNKGYCWPSLHTISRVTGIAVSTVKNRIDYLAKRKLISISKHEGKGHYPSTIRVVALKRMNRRVRNRMHGGVRGRGK